MRFQLAALRRRVVRARWHSATFLRRRKTSRRSRTATGRICRRAPRAIASLITLSSVATGPLLLESRTGPQKSIWAARDTTPVTRRQVRCQNAEAWYHSKINVGRRREDERDCLLSARKVPCVEARNRRCGSPCRLPFPRTTPRPHRTHRGGASTHFVGTAPRLCSCDVVAAGLVAGSVARSPCPSLRPLDRHGETLRKTAC